MRDNSYILFYYVNKYLKNHLYKDSFLFIKYASTLDNTILIKSNNKNGTTHTSKLLIKLLLVLNIYQTVPIK